jgi:hypothetical protein
MSYISTLNQDASPEVFSEDYLTHELNIWATAPLTFEDTPDFHLSSEGSDSDYVKTPASHHHQIPDEYLYPLLPIISNVGLPFVAPFSLNDKAKVDSNVSVPSDTAGITHAASLSNSKKKRKMSIDEAEKSTQNEDKRRRNTMASARFRQRKKLREVSLEQNAKEMTSKVDSLQKKVDSLEKEAKWLRSLLVEKDGSLPSAPSDDRWESQR